MNRDASLVRMRAERFDVAIIGGGATGLGCALDAASRGYATALIEARDFAKCTSSRSTKLVHGGVRYLRSGDFALVREALAERELLLRNAPAYVRELRFFVPARSLLSRAYYFAGLRLYDALAHGSRIGRSRAVRGGVEYGDAQFDDAQLAIAIARAATSFGAAVANYARACAIRRTRNGFEVETIDVETGETFLVRARSLINAGGIFADDVRRMDDPACDRMLAHSRGTHVVVGAHVLRDAQRATLVPKTSDGRVVFAIPWHGAALIGTTDVPHDGPEAEPHPSEAEITYLAATAAPYLAEPFEAEDVRSAFAGLRPLVRRSAARTSRLSREHAIVTSQNGLVSVLGGKWTTYRRMAQDAVDAAVRAAELPPAPCITQTIALEGTDAPADVRERTIHAVRQEMARTVEDVLARRLNTLFHDARQACEDAPGVASALAAAAGKTPEWEQAQVRDFLLLAQAYLPGARASRAGKTTV